MEIFFLFIEEKFSLFSFAVLVVLVKRSLFGKGERERNIVCIYRVSKQIGSGSKRGKIEFLPIVTEKVMVYIWKRDCRESNFEEKGGSKKVSASVLLMLFIIFAIIYFTGITSKWISLFGKFPPAPKREKHPPLYWY